MSLATITIRSTSVAVSAPGTIDSSTTGLAVGSPTGLAIGDYYVIWAVFQNAAGNTYSNSYTPTGFTELLTTHGTSSNRVLVAYGRPMNSAGDVTAVSSVTVKSANTATRVVAISAALSGVDLTTPVVGSSESMVYTDVSTGSLTFDQPDATTTGGVSLFAVYTNMTATTTHTSHTPVGGTLLNTGTALSAASGAASDTVLSLIQGGTGVTFNSSLVTSSGTNGLTLRPATIVDALATENWTGTTGAAWPAQWTTRSGSASIQSNAGRLTPAASNYAIARVDNTGMSQAGDVDMYFTVLPSVVAVESFFFAFINSDGGYVANTAEATNSYFLKILIADQAIQLGSTTSGTTTNNLAAKGVVWAAGTTYAVRLQRIGTSLRARVWASGATEPSTWDVSATVTTKTGRVGFAAVNGGSTTQRYFTVDDLTVIDQSPAIPTSGAVKRYLNVNGVATPIL